MALNLISHPRFFEFLNTFNVAATSRNFLEASQKLNISQANLSLQLRQLETLLPQNLFELKGKKKILTHFGIDFLNIASQALTEAHEQVSTFCQHRFKEEDLTLRVGCRPDYISTLQTKIRFRGNLEYISLSSESVSKAIQDKKIHLGITYLPPDSLDIVAIKAFKSGRSFITHPSQKLSDPMKIPKVWFHDKTAILFEDGQLLKEFIIHSNIKFFELRKLCVVDSWRAVIDLVSNIPNAYAIVPEYMKLHLNHLKTHTLSYDKFKPVDFYYVFLKSLKKNPVFASLISSLQKS